MGAVLYHQGEIAAALEHLELKPGDAEQALAFGPIDLRVGRSALQTPILWQGGRPDEAMERSANAVDLAASGPHPFNAVLALQGEAVVQHCCGDREKAMGAAVRLGSAAEEQGIHEVTAMARMLEASLRAGTDADELVVSLVDAGADACRTYGTVLNDAYVFAIGAEALLRIARHAEAEALLDEARQRIAGGSACFWEPELRRLQGEPERARGGRRRAMPEDCFRSAASTRFTAARRRATSAKRAPCSSACGAERRQGA